MPILEKNRKAIKETLSISNIVAETESLMIKIDKVSNKIHAILKNESLITQIDIEISFYEHRVTTTVNVYGINNPGKKLEISSIILFGQEVVHDGDLYDAVNFFVQKNC